MGKERGWDYSEVIPPTSVKLTMCLSPGGVIETQEQNKAGKVTALTKLTDSQRIPYNTEDRGKKIINSLQTVMSLYFS